MVKGVGEYAKNNVEYFLERVGQELDVYYKQIDTSETILNAHGKPMTVYTFSLKGKQKGQ